MTKKLIKKPVRVSKRFLNEGFLRAGQISFDFNKNALMNGAYGNDNLPTGSNPSTLEERNLRGAMILRAFLDYEGDTRDVSSIGEDLAAEIIGGEQINSAKFAGDNITFADVKKGDALYSVKIRGKSTKNSNRFSAIKISAIKHVLGDRRGSTKLGVILIDAKGKEDGFKFIHFEPREFNGELLEVEVENNKTYWQYNGQDILPPDQRNRPGEPPGGRRRAGGGLKTVRELTRFFDMVAPGFQPETFSYKVATAEQIDESLKLMYKTAIPEPPTFNNFLDKLVTAEIADIINEYPFFGRGLGAARGRSISFIKQSARFVEDDKTGKKRKIVYHMSSLYKRMSAILNALDEILSNMDETESNKVLDDMISDFETADETFAKMAASLTNSYQNNQSGENSPLNEDIKKEYKKLRETVESFKNYLEYSLLKEDRKLKSGCIPARRRIASGGKAGSYADARTGGKQAYAALKKAKPPGSKGGWTKKKCICCHKCPNDRSTPNGFVCTNPSHLYWGTKADNTYDQNRGNGWAARNKNKAEVDARGEKAFARELMVSEEKLRIMINKILLEDDRSVAE